MVLRRCQVPNDNPLRLWNSKPFHEITKMIYFGCSLDVYCISYSKFVCPVLATPSFREISLDTSLLPTEKLTTTRRRSGSWENGCIPILPKALSPSIGRILTVQKVKQITRRTECVRDVKKQCSTRANGESTRNTSLRIDLASDCSKTPVGTNMKQQYL